ncbi:MAG TPA: plastocyanin/azurin family copper-binding protein [Gemmatimonadales bacterium]|nr:plastocyanin/azurin family copper-binding protein [Gemmatimonadales bacterium]
MKRSTITGGVAALILLGACGGSDTPAPATDTPATEATSQVATPSVPLTGDTIVVEMFTDAEGNYFKPANITVKRGDVIRYTLGMGVHNVHFPADSNVGVTGLPPMSDMLQLPGQTFDVVVAMPAGGTYFYQCDPHALLGMVGHVTVE